MFPHCFLFHFFSLSFPIPVYDAIRNCQAKVFQTNKRKLMCEMHVKQKQQHNTSHLIAFYSLFSLSLTPCWPFLLSPELVRIERESRHFSFSFRTKNVFWGGSGEVLAQEEEESGRRNAQGREPRRRNPNSPFEYFIISNQMKKKPSTIQTLGRQLSQKAYSQRVRLIGKTRRDGWYLSVMKRSWREKLDWVANFLFATCRRRLSVLYDSTAQGNKKKKEKGHSSTLCSSKPIVIINQLSLSFNANHAIGQGDCTLRLSFEAPGKEES